MAWSATARGSAATTTAASSYSTGSYTPTALRLLIAFVNNVGPASPATADDQPAASGNGATWHLADEDLAGAGVSSMFVALSGASPTTTAFTATFGQNQTGCAISVFEVEIEGGVPASALDAIVQTTSVESSSAATSGSLALPVAPAATSSCVAGYVHNANEVTTPRVNWAEIHDVGYSTPNRRLQTQFRPATAEQTSSASWSSNVFWRAIMAEISETSVGGGTTFNITPAGTVTSAGSVIKGTSKGLGGTVSSSGVAMKAIDKPFAGTVASVGALIKDIAKPFTGTVTSSGALQTVKVVLLNLAGTISSAGTLVRDTSKGLAGALTPTGSIAKAISKPFSGTITSAGSLVSSVFETLRRWLFTPPTHEVVAWETGVDDRNKRADPVWRHYDRGDRGKTVVRTNGVYATYVNPLYTVLENADDIRLPDGTIGKAVFLGGHITEVTKAIKDELLAAGFSVDSEVA